ncbi:MAG: glycosyltransferase [Vicinamibacteria bacterium]
MSSTPGPLTGWLAHRLVRLITLVHATLLALPRRRVRRPAPDEPVRLLLTGMFHSEAWLAAHLGPLVASPRCGCVAVVAGAYVPELPKVEWVRPAPVLVRLVGGTGARLFTFALRAVRDRPHVVGGFHLLVNGLVAVALARLVGARSLVFNVGGTAEVDGGGRGGENRLFSLMPGPDATVERRLLRALDAADFLVTMGTGAKRSFEQRGVRASVHVIGGGIDASRFAPPDPSSKPEFDLVLVGRLAPIKRVDLFLDAVALVSARRPGTRAVVVGDGPLRASLEERARRPDLAPVVTFAGRQTDVAAWLRRARVFVLTSDSEGLPLSAVEAMMCGLPVVAPAVGDLPDIVEEGVNGHLVAGREAEAFARPLLALVSDEDARRRASAAAVAKAGRYAVPEAARLWDPLLDEVGRAKEGVA